MKYSFLIGNIPVSGSTVPLISTELTSKDFLGTIMVRWGINRDNYKVSPGLYAVGSPDSSSDVFVTANYKLSFDTLRKSLAGINGWILVLDTKGINVWCAAGKGTFGTNELVNRIKSVKLDKIVSHKRVILPQLGATGVAAHKVKDATGFNVHYGPVRAADIGKFIDDGYRATREMRKVTFNFGDRIKLIPNDFMYGKFYLLGAFVLVFLISFIKSKGIFTDDSIKSGVQSILNIFLAYSAGIFITPVLLPYLPGRQFSLKGFISGAFMAFILFLLDRTGQNIYEEIAWLIIIPVVSSFMAMNYTGSSTFTSLSGVKKEMKVAVPMQIILSSAGIILLIIGRLLN
jgi:hypothetical protein